MANNHGTR